MNAFVIDAFEFCRVRERREGELAVADLPRLGQESVSGFGSVKWQLAGGSDKQGHSQLTLSVSGSVRLICQRCLTPFEFPFETASVLILAETEGVADELDAQLEDESVEVIVGSRSFNIRDLIEDEALLALPLSPKHETCLDQLVSGVQAETEKLSPFSVLKDLKRS
ncbi:uncharacterized protein SAMN06265795_10629 [Noviherbaspirillum humi]|uniref:Large ribosomal RNA subunit accumulation protein YceD n=1 Tax=Noviherbaspirillum humi TaxID=1688639 RepID=A0A239H0B7_9BURK|nr:YceD family protein [Noviherbaspirillum humi]SNS74820.1 uncharacterized protein SAMN06265795_10629 [Noviherbaspirillum humi]